MNIVDKVAVDRIETEVRAKCAEKVARADVLFEKLLKGVEKDNKAYAHISNAKWHYDRNRHCSLMHFYVDYLPEELRADFNELYTIFDSIPYGQCLKTMTSEAVHLLDSEKKHFKGDLIITDPCYIIKDNKRPIEAPVKSDYVLDIDEYNDVLVVDTADLISHLPNALYEPIDAKTCKYSYKRDFDNSVYEIAKSEYNEGNNDRTTDDWNETGCGTNVEKLGIKQYIGRDTLFGDWDCVVVDADDKPIGEFCADAGMVCVAELNEWRNYNSEIDTFLRERSHCVAVISNFDGDVWFEVEDTSFDYKHDDGRVEFVKDYTVHVVGEGTRNGKPFKFKSVMGVLE